MPVYTCPQVDAGMHHLHPQIPPATIIGRAQLGSLMNSKAPICSPFNGTRIFALIDCLHHSTRIGHVNHRAEQTMTGLTMIANRRSSPLPCPLRLSRGRTGRLTPLHQTMKVTLDSECLCNAKYRIGCISGVSRWPTPGTWEPVHCSNVCFIQLRSNGNRGGCTPTVT